MANTAAGVAVQVLRSSRYPRWRASIRDLSTSPCRRTAEEPQAESSRAAAQAARARAWYLDDDDVAQQTSQPVRRPRFTTFDPMSTTDSAVPRLVRPFPNDAPAYLRSVWDFLMGDEAAEALDAGTVTLIRTRDQTARPRLDGDQIRGVEEVGPVWRWIIVAEVIGNARGVVARADGLLRRWLYDHPVAKSPSDLQFSGRRPKLPRIDQDAEWSIVKILEDESCINIFTKEGNEKYDLEGLWTGRSTVTM